MSLPGYPSNSEGWGGVEIMPGVTMCCPKELAVSLPPFQPSDDMLSIEDIIHEIGVASMKIRCMRESNAELAEELQSAHDDVYVDAIADNERNIEKELTRVKRLEALLPPGMVPCGDCSEPAADPITASAPVDASEHATGAVAQSGPMPGFLGEDDGDSQEEDFGAIAL